MMFSGCVLWLRADLGLTTVDAAVADPSDLSAAGWVAVRLSSRTATTITDQTDGAPTTHLVSQVIPGLQSNHLARFVIGIPSASGGGRYVGILPNAGGSYLAVDAQTGTITAQSGDVQNAVYSGGVLSFDLLVSSATFQIYTMAGSAIGDITYTGASNRTVTLGPNGLGAQITVIQWQASAVADQSGNGNHFTQGTGANQPAVAVDGGYAGKHALYFDGVSDALVSTMNLPQPFTAFFAGHLVSQAARMLFGTSAGAYFGANAATTIALNIGGAQISGNCDLTQRSIFTAVANVGSSVIRANGAQKAAGAVGSASLSSPAIGVTPSVGFYWYGWIPEVVIYNRVLSDPEITFVERKLGAYYGIPVA